MLDDDLTQRNAVSATDTIAELRGVERTYGDGPTAVHALSDVDLTLRRGEVVVVLGPSGSGKTTLLNVLGGIDQPTAGRVLVDGADLTTLDSEGLTTLRRDAVGFVFQFFNLVPTLTARENVELIADLTDHDGDAAERSLTEVGLADRSDHFPGQLSGGEQQRVAVARAISKRPPLLLCDEPTGALDLETGRPVLALLQRLAREHGHTVVVVTHNQPIAAMADHVVRLRSGRVVEDRRVPHPVDAGEVEW
jgi:putative ABC transport system ATP-binding protein